MVIRTSGISDIISALTYDNKRIYYGYWKRNKTQGTAETFANLYASEVMNDTEEIEYIKIAISNTYSEYRKIMDEIGK